MILTARPRKYRKTGFLFWSTIDSGESLIKGLCLQQSQECFYLYRKTQENIGKYQSPANYRKTGFLLWSGESLIKSLCLQQSQECFCLGLYRKTQENIGKYQSPGKLQENRIFVMVWRITNKKFVSTTITGMFMFISGKHRKIQENIGKIQEKCGCLVLTGLCWLIINQLLV